MPNFKLSLQKQAIGGLSVSSNGDFSKFRVSSRNQFKCELMKVTESDPTLTSRQEASKLRRTHGAIRYRFKQFHLVSKLLGII